MRTRSPQFETHETLEVSSLGLTATFAVFQWPPLITLEYQTRIQIRWRVAEIFSTGIRDSHQIHPLPGRLAPAGPAFAM